MKWMLQFQVAALDHKWKAPRNASVVGGMAFDTKQEAVDFARWVLENGPAVTEKVKGARPAPIAGHAETGGSDG
jgi:hypothetical protein